MASNLGGPWSVLNEIRYYRGGDSTRQAVGKIIEEFKRLYEIINILDNGKTDGAGGTGVPASVITGELENATIKAEKVEGLEEAIRALTFTTSNIAGLADYIKDTVNNNFVVTPK